MSEAFVYDPAGNRTSHTNTNGDTIGYTVDATGQLISDTTGTTYSYDGAGNLLGNSDGDAFEYDDYGRTTQATANGVTQNYGYDAANVRVSVDGDSQLWDRSGLPTLISTSAGESFVHNNTGIIRASDDWLLADAIGSVQTVVDNAGATISAADYTVFGEQLAGDAGIFGFVGQQLDPTGLQHLRARDYNPTLGRFTTVDPVQPGAPGTTGYNLYAYSGNNPTTFTDPTGQAVFAEYGALAGRGALLGASFSAALTPWTCDQADNAWYEPSTNIDASCQLTEIGLGAIFGAIGGAGAGTGAGASRLAAVACGWGAVEGGTGAAAHATVQGEQISTGSVGLSAAFGCVTAGLVAGGARAWTNRGPTLSTNGAHAPLEITTRTVITNSPGFNSRGVTDVLDRNIAGSGFSGAYDTQSGTIVALPSGPSLLADTGLAPPNRVSLTGGHVQASTTLTAINGSSMGEHVGFAVVPLPDGTLEVRWNSGVLNTQHGDRAAPEWSRQAIVEAIEQTTGLSVSVR